MIGPEYAGSLAGRAAIEEALQARRLQVTTCHLPHRIPGLGSIDHIAVPESARIQSSHRIVAESPAGRRLSDHDLYLVDVTIDRRAHVAPLVGDFRDRHFGGRVSRCKTSTMGGDGAASAVPSAPREGLVALQGLVEQKLGRCLIRLQQYELVLKDFVARARVEGAADSISEIQAAKAAVVATQTLGQVVGAFIGVVFEDPNWDDGGFPPSPTTGDAWTASAFTMTLSDDELAATKLALAELVALRNELVHGFVMKHDLQSEAGCLTAAAALDLSYEVIDRHLRDLRDWYKGMLDLSQAVAEMLANPKNHQHLFPGSPGEGSEGDKPARAIVELLHHAEAELSRDGWTLLDEAVAFIRRVAPEHTLARYGYSTWRQVLHESRALFDVRREVAGPGKPSRTRYRSAQAVPSSTAVSP